MLKRVLNGLKYVIFGIIILILIMTILQRILPDNSGLLKYRTFIIVSNSMYPYLKVGDIILVERIDPLDYHIGDVVTYKGNRGEFNDKLITHKIVSISHENGRPIIYTKGINNYTQDEYAVYESQIYGKMILKLGILSVISGVLSTALGKVFIVVIPIILLLLLELKDVKKDIKRR